MVYDLEFPNYATRILRLTAILGILFALAAAYFGWQYSVGVVLGTLFQYGFLWFLKKKYLKWSEEGRAPDAIGAKLVGYTGFRFFLEVAIAVVTALCIGIGVLGVLVGLLSLTTATVADKVISVIKE